MEDLAHKCIPDWPFQVGDYVSVTERTGCDDRPRHYRGKVIAVTPAMLVVDTGKYKTTVHKGAWYCKMATVKKL
ncbi:MAG: hypothetical protein ACPL5F_01580 [Moorellaceae bacterium]